MAMVEHLRGSAGQRPSAAREVSGTATAARSDRPARALIGALLLLLLYAAFAHGAVGSNIEVRVQVAIAGLAAVAGATSLWSSGLRLSASPVAFAGAGLLAAFAAWSGLSLLWSVAPDQTWIEFNRDLTYVIVLVLAIMAGASHPRSVEMVGKGFLVVALTVTVYALGQKVAPGIHIGSIIDFNQTAVVPRLQAPLEYWNALALFITLAVPIALALAVDCSRREHWRLAALVGVQLMLLVIGLTYSRGGFVALALALVLSIALGRARLRSLMWLALSCVAAIPPLLVGLTDHSLTNSGVSLGARESAAGTLAAVLVVSVLVLCFGGRLLLRREAKTRLTPERVRGVGRLLVLAAAVVLLCAVLAVAASSRGLTGSVSHAWHSFTTARSANVYDPHHLLSSDSGNRWVWWKEAGGAFSDRPLAGWGAGSFPVVHLLYRRDTLSVRQPHSVPFQFLAEVGLVGTMLGIGAYGLLFAAGVRTTRRRPPGSERMLAAALLAGGVAYAAHALYDWDWDIPGVTLPAIVFLGVVAGARGYGAQRPAMRSPGLGLRSIAIAVLTFALCTFALSALLPNLAGSRASSALVAASSSSPARLQSALATADVATRIDPVSDEGLKAAATIATHRGQLATARAYLLDAIRRDPNDAGAWEQLAGVEIQLGDRRGLIRAVNRALALDPRGKLARALGRDAYALIAPTSPPPTVVQTPLPPA